MNNLLHDYQQKRSFDKTPEPSGKEDKQADAIFVVQKHQASHLHYDFRLAINGVLKSWAVPKEPSLDPTIKRLAVEVEDHPLSYAHFEGTIPKGEYGAGQVEIWDQGIYQAKENLESAYQKGVMKFILNGKKLKGEWHLIKTKIIAKNSQWLLMKAKDEYSKS